MAFSIPVNTPSAEIETELIRLFTTHHGYRDTITDINGDPVPNPMTRIQFLRQTVRRQIKEVAQAQRREEVEAQAVQNLPDIDIT